MNQRHQDDDRRDPGYESRDMDPGGVGLVGTMLALGLVLTSIVCAIFYQTTAFRTERAEGPVSVPVPAERARFPAPELENRPADSLARLREKEDALLESYGWIDPQRGIVRIPVERAMELTAWRGLPDRGEQKTQPSNAPTWEQMLQLRGEEGSAAVDAERRRP